MKNQTQLIFYRVISSDSKQQILQQLLYCLHLQQFQVSHSGLLKQFVQFLNALPRWCWCLRKSLYVSFYKLLISFIAMFICFPPTFQKENAYIGCQFTVLGYCQHMTMQNIVNIITSTVTFTDNVLISYFLNTKKLLTLSVVGYNTFLLYL